MKPIHFPGIMAAIAILFNSVLPGSAMARGGFNYEIQTCKGSWGQNTLFEVVSARQLRDPKDGSFVDRGSLTLAVRFQRATSIGFVTTTDQTTGEWQRLSPAPDADAGTLIHDKGNFRDGSFWIRRNVTNRSLTLLFSQDPEAKAILAAEGSDLNGIEIQILKIKVAHPVLSHLLVTMTKTETSEIRHIGFSGFVKAGSDSGNNAEIRVPFIQGDVECSSTFIDELPNQLLSSASQ